VRCIMPPGSAATLGAMRLGALTRRLCDDVTTAHAIDTAAYGADLDAFTL